jgi:hypothetical protein
MLNLSTLDHFYINIGYALEHAMQTLLKRHLIQYIEQRLQNRWETTTTTTTNPFEPIKLSS